MGLSLHMTANQHSRSFKVLFALLRVLRSMLDKNNIMLFSFNNTSKLLNKLIFAYIVSNI